MKTLSREQVRALDRMAIDKYGVPGMVLMENAGRGVVDVLLEESAGAEADPGPVVVCCGGGNNAGDGFVIARRLELLGRGVRVLRWGPEERLAGDALRNFEILRRAGLEGRRDPPARELDAALEGAAWIVDALLGTGARGAPRPPLDAVIERLNASPARGLAVDLPSGLDADTGATPGPVFRADVTCTFVAPKPGLLAPSAARCVGRLRVVDVGAPRALLQRFGVEGIPALRRPAGSESEPRPASDA